MPLECLYLQKYCTMSPKVEVIHKDDVMSDTLFQEAMTALNMRIALLNTLSIFMRE